MMRFASTLALVVLVAVVALLSACGGPPIDRAGWHFVPQAISAQPSHAPVHLQLVGADGDHVTLAIVSDGEAAPPPYRLLYDDQRAAVTTPTIDRIALEILGDDPLPIHLVPLETYGLLDEVLAAGMFVR